MMNSLTIYQDRLIDNDSETHVEFTAEIDRDDRGFTVKYAVLREVSGDKPGNDALELFERFSDENLDI